MKTKNSHLLSIGDTLKRHFIPVKSQGFFQTPQDIMEEYNGCSVLRYTAYGLKVGGGRTSLSFPNPRGSTRSNHQVGSRFAPSRTQRRGNQPPRRLFDRSSTEN